MFFLLVLNITTAKKDECSPLLSSKITFVLGQRLANLGSFGLLKLYDRQLSLKVRRQVELGFPATFIKKF
jgi:hypothetical protein